MVSCRCGSKTIKVGKVTPKKVAAKKVTPKQGKVTNKSMSAHLSKLATMKAKKAATGCKCS